MQYINSNLGIPIKASFADMMAVNSYSNASGDSVSSLESKIAKIQSELASLDNKRQKENVKLKNEQEKERRGYGKIASAKFKEGERDIRQANVGANQAKTEIKNIETKMALLNIDLASLQSQLDAMGGAPAPAPRPLPPTPKPPTPSVPPIGGGAGSAGLVPLPEGSTDNSSSDSTAKPKKNWVMIGGIGLVAYVAVAYFVNKVVKPQ